MRRLRGWLLRGLSLLHRQRLDGELAAELESHLDMDTEDGIRRGLSPEEARRQAVLRLGGVEPVKERYREQRGIPLLETLGRDLAYAVRMLRSHAGFTATVVLTLALGIGATTALFSVVNGVLLRPLPYPQPEQLVYVSVTLRGEPNPLTYAEDYHAFRDHNRTLSQIAGYGLTAANFVYGEQSERVSSGLATRSLFELLGARPALGRNFLPEEEATSGPPAVLLSDGFWRSHFAADPAVVGKSVVLDGRSHSIVGVLPAGFRVPSRYAQESDFALWLPIARDGKGSRLGGYSLYAVGRLKPGATIAQASADLDALQQVKLFRGGLKRIIVSAWQDEITGAVRRPLLIFLGAVSLVLLIACANVANLLLARASTREREVAVRFAMGAGRGRIVRQLLTESALLGLLGGLLGLAFAYWGKTLLLVFLASNLPTLDPIRMDWRVLLFSLLVGVSTGIAFGLAPALQVSRFDVAGSLKESARGSSEGRSSQRLRGLLVVAEVALAMVLLSGAGLLARSFLRLRGVDGGYRADHVLMMTMRLTESQYHTAAAQAEFFRAALERIAGLPGVVSAGATTSPPFGGYTIGLHDVELEGRPPADVSTTSASPVYAAKVSPDYFRTLGIPLLGGRAFTPADRAGAPTVAVVSESFARRFCPAANCLGQRLANWDKEGDWMTIVGVVRDVRAYPEDDARTEVYASYLQVSDAFMTVVVRTSGDPLAMTAALRSQFASVDKTQPPHRIRTMEMALDDNLTQRRVKTLFVLVLAALALTLGAVGIYGVLAYAVRQRTHEIGIRLALGAERGQILGMVVRNGLRLVAAGVVLGLTASLALSRLIASELWGVKATDPLTLALVASVLLASGLAASLLPALRAAGIDPMLSLRHE